MATFFELLGMLGVVVLVSWAMIVVPYVIMRSQYRVAKHLFYVAFPKEDKK